MPLFLVFEALMGFAGQTMPKENWAPQLTGRTAFEIRDDPVVGRYVHLMAIDSYALQFGLALFIAVVASTAFRQGQKWAWWLMWYIPVWAVLQATIMLSAFSINIFPFIAPMMVLSLLALLLPIRRFFSMPTPSRSLPAV